MSDARPFQVDLKSVVDLLSRHIYSSPRVFLRELLQNGVDAISARKEFSQASGGLFDPDWGVRIVGCDTPDAEFVLEDDGIGLTADEVADMLATVGRSSKRDIFDMRRTDFLGQFGIGLLSCFMVSDKIRILSRSARGGAGVEWVGSNDGLFTVSSADDLPVGTSVHLRPRFDTGDLLSTQSVEQLARLYGEYLPVSVTLAKSSESVQITCDPPFLSEEPDREELGSFCENTLGYHPMAAFPLSAPGSLTSGYAFVLPFAPPPTARPTARTYLGRMLLAERADDLIPDWAFFLRAVVNSNGLTPTASREALVNDHSLGYTNEQFSNSIRSWLMDTALHHPAQMTAFLRVHEAAIKQLILHDEQMAGVFIGWLSLETTEGRVTVEELVRKSPHVRYARTLDEFRQIAPIIPRGSLLVNGGYVHDSELCELIGAIYPEASVERVDIMSELDRLEPPSLAERTATVQLEDRASAVVASRECRVVVRVIDAEDMPALFVADPEVFRHIDRGRASSASGSGLWSQILAQTDAFAREHSGRQEEGFVSRLCLNWGNALIRSLAAVDDQLVFDRCVRLLYVQSQLAGHRPLSNDDRVLMTTALTDLIALSTTH